jgi:drug/metabolite transporter (DMT)-like permease
VTVLVQPVVAAGIGWLAFSERITPVQALGAAVLLAGVVLAQVSARARTKTGGAPSGAPPVEVRS